MYFELNLVITCLSGANLDAKQRGVMLQPQIILHHFYKLLI